MVLSTAGPFALYGGELVAACVRHGTHYVDITGETPWVRDLIHRHDTDARASGTRIVPCCGFDSVPSDLGTWVLAHEIRERFGEPCREVTSAFSLRGGFNGGTIASLLNVMAEGGIEAFANPFLLNPPGTAPADTAPHRDPAGPAPRRRPPRLAGPVPDGAHQHPCGAALGGTSDAGRRRVRGRLPLRRVHAPRPRGPRGRHGVGHERRHGRHDVRAAVRGRPAARRALVTRAGRGAHRGADGPRRLPLRAGGAQRVGPRAARRVSAKGDPGNRATTVFVCESALALVRNLDVLPPGGGVMTRRAPWATCWCAAFTRRA